MKLKKTLSGALVWPCTALDRNWTNTPWWFACSRCNAWGIGKRKRCAWKQPFIMTALKWHFAYAAFRSAAAGLQETDFPAIIRLADGGILAMRLEEIHPRGQKILRKRITFRRCGATRCEPLTPLKRDIVAEAGENLVILSKFKTMSFETQWQHIRCAAPCDCARLWIDEGTFGKLGV